MKVKPIKNKNAFIVEAETEFEKSWLLNFGIEDSRNQQLKAKLIPFNSNEIAIFYEKK